MGTDKGMSAQLYLVMFRPKPKINMPQNQAAGVSVLEATAVQRRCPNTSIIGQKCLYSDYSINFLGSSIFQLARLIHDNPTAQISIPSKNNTIL